MKWYVSSMLLGIMLTFASCHEPDLNAEEFAEDFCSAVLTKQYKCGIVYIQDPLPGCLESAKHHYEQCSDPIWANSFLLFYDVCLSENSCDDFMDKCSANNAPVCNNELFTSM